MADLAQLRALFDQIIDLPDAERESRLIELGADDEVRARVLRLAHASDGHTSRATQLQRQIAGHAESPAVPELSAGDVLGSWRLVAEVGRGGMGAVFLAQRIDGHFEQQAAVKVLGGTPSAAALELLARERQILARLSHPNIARLLDGGATPKGRPYLVMEYVAGQPLDIYLRQASPGLRQRLRLFNRIGEAVAFAHAQLVVHCDLKPSNVMVDEAARPILLDFGIAKLLDAGLSRRAVHGSNGYTPGYASPELQRGEAVGVASDVYSLGVILKEVLEGCDGGDHPDLSAIAARATQAAANQRYASVTLLIQDLWRFLDGFPVLARGQQWSYVLGKLLRRRWPAFVAGMVFLVTVTVFSWGLLEQRNEALAARVSADREAAAATASNEFLQSLFAGADVEKDGARELTALELVGRGWARVATEFDDQPATKASMYAALANVYMNLGEPTKARQGFDRAIAIERGLRPARPLQLALYLRNAAQQAANEGRDGDGEALGREALALAERYADPISRDVGNAATALALNLLRTGSDEAESLLLRHLQIREALGEPEVDLASTWHNLGLVARNQGQFEKAVDFNRLALAAKRRALGDAHARTLNSMESLASALTMSRNLDEAETLVQRALELRRRVNGELSSKTQMTVSLLADIQGERGNFVGAIDNYRLAIRTTEQLGGAGTPDHARLLNNLAYYLDHSGNLEGAVDVLRQALQIRERTLAKGDPRIARAQAGLGRMLMLTGQMSEASGLLEAAATERRKRFPPEHRERLSNEIVLVDWLRRNGDVSEARAALDQLAPQLQAADINSLLRALPARAWLEAAEGQADAARASMDEYLAAVAKRYSNNTAEILNARTEQLELWQTLGDGAQVAAALDSVRTQVIAVPLAFPPNSSIHPRLVALSAQLGH